MLKNIAGSAILKSEVISFVAKMKRKNATVPDAVSLSQFLSWLIYTEYSMGKERQVSSTHKPYILLISVTISFIVTPFATPTEHITVNIIVYHYR